MSNYYRLAVVCGAVLVATLVPAAAATSRQTPNDNRPRALVSLLVDSWSVENYLSGAVALARSALKHAPGYFESVEMMVLNGGTYSPTVLEYVQMAGWKLRWVDPIVPPHQTDINLYKDQFAKLHLWAMEEYQEVVCMDLDVVFAGRLQGTFTSADANSTGCKMWAARDIRDGVWEQGFNMGVAAIRPNATEYNRLLELLRSDVIKYEYWQSEQGFLTAVYTAESGWCVLPFEKNANIAAYAQLPDFWRAASDKIQVVHHTLSKPMWNGGCKPDSPYAPLCDEWRAELSSSTRPVTVVTAYYTAAFGTNTMNAFRAWRRLLLDKDVAVVVFTDDTGSVPLVGRMNPDLTRVIELGTEQLMASAAYFDWSKQLQLLQSEGHSPSSIDALKVGLEKPMFVMRAIEQNPFHSSHYVWMDFAALRSDRWGSDWTFHAGRIPPGNRLLMLNAPAASTEVDTAIMGGSVPAWQQWTSHYRQALVNAARDGQQFYAADSVIAASVAMQHPHSACRLKPADTGDYWKWFLQYYLAGKTAVQACAAHNSKLRISE